MVLVFDIGKTNKKCLVFDADYRVVFEEATQLAETVDEDGDPCEDILLLQNWILDTFARVLREERFRIRAVNGTAYGASFVHLDAAGNALTPLYNYLKPFPVELRKRFFETYGGEEKMALETASPILGHLNSGLQLYWLKNERPEIFRKIKWSLHLPQYVAWLLRSCLRESPRADQPVSEITSIGCHTLLWDFQKNDYHNWVKAENITEKFPPITPLTQPYIHHSSCIIHHSLHDSSAALVPYLAHFREPFVLLSTGTWCISLNPFNSEPLTGFELQNDCLCYLTFEGKPVKAARYFGGNEHENAVRRISEMHGVALGFYKNAGPEPNTPAEAEYLAFMRQLVDKQVFSTRLALGNSAVQRIYVDGGFSKNEIFMRLLAAEFSDMEVFAAEVAQATALGAALVLHDCWNARKAPQNLILLKKY